MMARHYTNLLIFIARLTQIACGILMFSCALVATKRSEDYDPSADHDQQFAAMFLGIGVGLFGIFGLFGCKRRAEEPEEVRLSTLILCMDGCALVICFGAAVLCTVQASSWQDWDEPADPALLYVPAAIAYFCGGFVLLPLIVRTLRLWWKVLLYRVPQHLTPDKQIDLEGNCAHACCHQHQRPDYELAYTQPAEARRSHQTEAAKSTFSSRPHSVISGADTLTYPNIGNVAQSGAPTRAPSHAAPSYTSRVEVGSKVNQS